MNDCKKYINKYINKIQEKKKKLGIICNNVDFNCKIVNEKKKSRNYLVKQMHKTI